MPKGFIRHQEQSRLAWVPCDDDQLLLDSDPDTVSFAQDQEELVAQLSAARPAPEPDLSYLWQSWTSIHSPTLPNSYYSGPCVLEYDEPQYKPGKMLESSEDVSRVCELARLHKRVRACATQIRDTVTAHGCYVQGDYVLYSPKRAAKRVQAQQTALVAGAVLYQTTRELHQLARASGQHQRLWATVRPDYTDQSLAGNAYTFLGMYDLLVLVLGKQAVRRAAPLQALLASWAKNRAGNAQKYRNCGVDDQGQPTVNQHGADLVTLLESLLPKAKTPA